MPPSLGKLARQEWDAIVPLLTKMGVLTTVDGKALSAYCHAYERWVQAEKEVQGRGILVEEPLFNKEGEEVGTRIKTNPAVGISERSQKLMKSFLVEFGMTPASRSRLRIEKGGDENPEDAYVRRKMEQAGAGSRVN